VENIVIFSSLSIGYFVIKGAGFTLECKAHTSNHKSSRLVDSEEDANKKDVPFDWKQLFELLWLDILSLSVAIIVSIILNWSHYTWKV
jgi:hypothetical protein